MAEFHMDVKAARRNLGMTQSALADAVGCKQSAISMMERGRMSAIARPTLQKIAELLGLEFPDEVSLVQVSAPAIIARQATYCPAFDCPSNLPYVVSGDLIFLPNAKTSGKHCAYCGEVLESRCPGCGQAAGPGACCTLCGVPYVSAAGVEMSDPELWADQQRERIQQIVNLLPGR